MAKGIRKFRIIKTNDEEITVEDMEKEEEKEVIDTGGETYDAAEIKEVSDMCKDMGFESIKDAIAELKAAKDKAAKDEKEDKELPEKKEKTDDEDPEAAEKAKKEKEEKKKTADAAIADLEVTIAGIEDVKVKDSMINLVARVKDGLKGYELVESDLSKEIFKAKAKDEELAKKQPDFNMNEFFGAHNPHKKGGN